MFALIQGLTACRVLPPDLVQLDGLHSGMAFDGKQSIRSLNRPMLAGVARQNQPRIPLSHEPDQFKHLLSANLTSLIHDNGGAFGQFTFGQKTGHGCG